MEKHFAAVALTIVLTMNIGSGFIQKIDQKMVKFESALCEEMYDRTCTEQILEGERKLKSCAGLFSKY